MRLSESVRIRRKTRETPPFPPISYPALAGLIGTIVRIMQARPDTQMGGVWRKKPHTPVLPSRHMKMIANGITPICIPFAKGMGNPGSHHISELEHLSAMEDAGRELTQKYFEERRPRPSHSVPSDRARLRSEQILDQGLKRTRASPVSLKPIRNFGNADSP